MVPGSRSCCHLRPHRLVAVLGATRSSAGFHYFPDQDLPHRQLLPRRRPYSLRRPHWLRTLDAAVEIHQRGECVLIIRRLLNALEVTDGPSSADLAIGVTGDRIEGGGKDAVAKGEG